MKRIVITGAEGVIGTILRKALTEYDITPLDISNIDLRNYESLLEVFPQHDAVIHLAWNAKAESSINGGYDPDNSLMTNNVYRAAIETGVPRVIMASSVHAHNPPREHASKLLSPYGEPVPDSPYGANKVFIEALGKQYANNHNLEVICLRLGGINQMDKVFAHDNDYERSIWLSHNDCTDLIKKCLEAEYVPRNYQIINAVSNNGNSIYDYSNPFGWVPNDSVEFCDVFYGNTARSYQDIFREIQASSVLNS